MNSNQQHNNSYIYRLPLDLQVDKDIIDWIDSFPNKKKAEIIRYALRFYIGQLKDHEVFKLSRIGVNPEQAYAVTEKVKKKPKISKLRDLS